MITIKKYIENAISRNKDGIVEIDIGSDDGIHVNQKSLNRIKFRIGPR